MLDHPYYLTSGVALNLTTYPATEAIIVPKLAKKLVFARSSLAPKSVLVPLDFFQGKINCIIKLYEEKKPDISYLCPVGFLFPSICAHAQYERYTTEP